MGMRNKLAAARKACNLTQEQLAQRLGVSRQAVSRWESDTAYPETDKIVRMARLLNVSCDYLLREEVEDPGVEAPPPDPVTRLLKGTRDRKVRIEFWDEDQPVIPACRIRELDGKWLRVETEPGWGRKEAASSLVPASSIRSITFLKEDV